MTFDARKALHELAMAMLRNRELARLSRDEALASGNKKDARAWASELRKLEKLITQYGLEHYA